MRTSLFSIFSILCLTALLTACSAEPKSAEGQADLKADAARSVADFRRADPEIAKHIDNAYGYAVFPTIGKGGVGVGGAAGKGVVYERGTPIGYAHMTQATVGLQLGGQAYSQLILFEDKAALDRFTKSEWAMSAQATAVAAASGAAATAKYKDGVMVFVTNQEGLMAEASLGGQKFKFEPMR
jgi:lipid-binding SYLF domain-containing protein